MKRRFSHFSARIGLEAPFCQTPFRGRVSRATLHARRRLHGAERPWGGEKALDGGHGSRCEETCEETIFTPFDSDRARGAVLSDAVQGACRACAALRARRRLHGAERPWGGEKALDGVHGVAV